MVYHHIQPQTYMNNLLDVQGPPVRGGYVSLFGYTVAKTPHNLYSSWIADLRKPWAFCPGANYPILLGVSLVYHQDTFSIDWLKKDRFRRGMCNPPEAIW